MANNFTYSLLCRGHSPGMRWLVAGRAVALGRQHKQPRICQRSSARRSTCLRWGNLIVQHVCMLPGLPGLAYGHS